jgi:hypothetical protein
MDTGRTAKVSRRHAADQTFERRNGVIGDRS